MGKKKRTHSYIYTLIICFLLFVGVYFLMNHVQDMVHSDVRINLSEIVTQNKDVITSKVQLEINNLELISKQVSERISLTVDQSDSNIRDIFLAYAKQSQNEMVAYSDKDGNAVYGNGQEVNISGRRYFKLAMQGKQNISERTISRLNGEDIFVISVPLKYQGKIIGTIQKQYTPSEMYDICSISLFSQQGSMYIINSEGYILISSEQDGEFTKESSNYYRMVYLSDPEASELLEKNITEGNEGFMEVTVEGEKLFSAYTPIEGVHDWYLITSIKTTAIMPNSSTIIKLFYIILMLVVVTLAAMMIYHLWLKSKQRMHLERIAFVDDVTGGDTFTKFAIDVNNILSESIEAQDFAILVFDIDNFKYINGYYGFDVGDHILKEIYGLYQQKLSEEERITRTSADHFVVFLKDATKERLEKLFSWELFVSDIKVYLSAGLYHIKDTKESINLIIDKANIASQEIKGRGYKEIAIYSHELDDELIKNEQLKRQVEKALEEDEIIPFFQPKVDIYTNKLVGAEALARWITKDGKMVSPAEFIPVCEKTGAVDAVDWKIFDKTLEFISTNLKRNVTCVPISVNFSRVHLLNRKFLQTMKEKLEAFQVPGNLIEVELTETIIFDNVGNINKFIDGLHKIDIKVSMDDFGSGYSSLQMLKDVDIDIIKIDRGFLQETSDSKKQKVIFESIIHMANELKLKSVVEGIETVENIELMKEAGCKVAQGYYFSRPVEESIFQRFYEEGKL